MAKSESKKALALECCLVEGLPSLRTGLSVELRHRWRLLLESIISRTFIYTLQTACSRMMQDADCENVRLEGLVLFSESCDRIR